MKQRGQSVVSTAICYAIWVWFLNNLSENFRKSEGGHFYSVYWRGQQSKPLILCLLICLVDIGILPFSISSSSVLISNRRILKPKFQSDAVYGLHNVVPASGDQVLFVHVSWLWYHHGGTEAALVERACTWCSSTDDRYISFFTFLYVCVGSSFVLCYIALFFSPKYVSLSPPCCVDNWSGIQECNGWWYADRIADFSEILRGT
jgi:hypothetical protein